MADRHSYKKIAIGEFKGWMDEGLLDILPSSFLENPVSSIKEIGGKVIKESKLRWSSIIVSPDGKRIFLKKDITKGWFESFKYLFLPSKAQREWFIAHQLKRYNLPIPEPLGWMERVSGGFVKESYYFSKAIGSGASLIDDPMKLKDGSTQFELAKTLKKIHDKGLFHKDLHAGNLLWDGNSFYITDLHRAKIFHSLPLRKRLWNMSQLFHSLRHIWSEKERIQFIEKYFEDEHIHIQKSRELLERIYFLMSYLQKRQWQSRSKRCLKNSTEFSIIKDKGFLYYHRRDFPLDQIKRIVDAHIKLAKEMPSCLVKRSEKVAISILNGEESRVCVKQFKYNDFWSSIKENLRPSKGMKAWVAGNSLIVRGINSLKPLALMEIRDRLKLRESIFLIESPLTNQELDRYILGGFVNWKEKTIFIKTFAKWLFNLHQRKIYHKDMKTSNILVLRKDKGWDFFLIDMEDIQLDKEITERRLFKNLLQLNTSTPDVIKGTDRLLFFREYLYLNPIVKDRKVFIKRLMEESKKRGSVYAFQK